MVNYSSIIPQKLFSLSGSSSPVVSNLLPLGKRITGDIDILGDIAPSNINLSGDITIGGNIFS